MTNAVDMIAPCMAANNSSTNVLPVSLSPFERFSKACIAADR